MDDRINERVIRRVLFVGRLAVVWAALIAGRLIHWQVFRHEELAKASRSQREHTIRLSADRGEIEDRTGKPLAITIRTESVAVNPQKVANPEFFAGNVAPILNLNATELAMEIHRLKAIKPDRTRRTRDPREPSPHFLLLARHISPGQKDALRRLPFGVLDFIADTQRHYPGGESAAHVIGTLDADGNGVVGIERRFNDTLKGKPALLRVLTDSLQDRYQTWVMRPGEPGANLRLTLQHVIQYEAEQALAEAIEKSGAWSGSVVVMNPNNGDVYSLVSYPTFDPAIAKPSKEQALQRNNIAIQAPGEPGSVSKMITVAMGIDTGRYTAESVINCENGRWPRPKRKPITDLHRYGALTVSDILVKSSNIGVAKISYELGPAKLYEYLHKFGMGERTGIQLPGEDDGILRPLERWDPASHEYIAFGHEIAATSIQLARAVSVVANGGRKIRPRLVIDEERIDPISGTVKVSGVRGEEGEQVLDPKTAATLRHMMRLVVEEGTGKAAAIPGYSAGGKTGSAELWEGKVKRRDRHNASFVGFVPATRPEVVIVVTVNGSRLLGGVAAAPAFRRIGEAAMSVLQVAPDNLENLTKLAPKKEETLRKGDELALLAEVKPAPQPTLQPNAEPPAAEAAPAPELVGPRVPDFTGKPVVAVLRESASLQLPVSIVGKGRAKGQKPAPGTILPPGARVMVEFARD